MNTGKEIETSRLWLRPGKNERDSSPFLLMLRNDGDFQQYCGARFSEENLSRFANYFERVNDEMCMYSLFLKTDAETFIGYVGFHREGDGTFELEFYIAKEYRRNGYCEEACRAVIGQLFGEGLSVNGKLLSENELYATTLAENEPTLGLLKKLGFTQHMIEDGATEVMQIVVDLETGKWEGIHTTKKILKKEQCLQKSDFGDIIPQNNQCNE